MRRYELKYCRIRSKHFNKFINNLTDFLKSAPLADETDNINPYFPA